MVLELTKSVHAQNRRLASVYSYRSQEPKAQILYSQQGRKTTGGLKVYLVGVDVMRLRGAQRCSMDCLAGASMCGRVAGRFTTGHNA